MAKFKWKSSHKSQSHTAQKAGGGNKMRFDKAIVNNLSMCALSFRLGEMAKWKRAKSTKENGGLVVT